MVQQSVLLTASLLFLSCGPIWRSPDFYTSYPEMDLPVPILTSEQYGALAPLHARPYAVSIPDTLLLFGAEHTKNPDDPQIDSLTAEWRRFRPTVALVESRLGFLFRWTTHPVEKFGESGWVYDLAQTDGIPCYTWEPPMEQEIAWITSKFSRKRAALFYILRPYFGQVKFGIPDDPNGMVTGTIGRRTAWKGMEQTIRSVADIDSIWKADFREFKDWRETDDRYGWPGYLNDIAKESNAFRDEHFVRVILHLIRRGERVFAVCGSSHAVKLEGALKSALP